MAAEVVHVAGNNMVELHTPRLLLRGAQDGDADYLHSAFADPEVMRYWYEKATDSTTLLLHLAYTKQVYPTALNTSRDPRLDHFAWRG